jgi:bisphosphoglycerate-dependent phosphoglycerate mutase
VRDLVPYSQEAYTYAEIIRWIPTLTAEEITLVERYYREHQAELDEEDKQIRAYVAEQIHLQRRRFPEEPREVRLARMKETLRRRQKERNGKGNPG